MPPASSSTRTLLDSASLPRSSLLSRSPELPCHARSRGTSRCSPVGSVGRGFRRLGGERLLGSPAEPRGSSALAIPPSASLLPRDGLVGPESTTPGRRDVRPVLDVAAGSGARLRRSGGRRLLRRQAHPGSVGPRQHQLPPRVAGTSRCHAVLPSLAPQRRAGDVEQELRRFDPGRRLAVRHAVSAWSMAARVRLRQPGPRCRQPRPPGFAVEGRSERAGATIARRRGAGICGRCTAMSGRVAT